MSLNLLSLPENVLEIIFAQLVCPVTAFGERIKIVAREPVGVDGVIPLRGVIDDILSSYERGESDGHPWNPLSLCTVSRDFARLIPQWALRNVQVELTEASKFPAMIEFLKAVPTSSDEEAPRISYIKKLEIGDIDPDIKFPTVDLRGTFAQATALQQLCLGSDFFHSKNADVSMFNCPNLTSLEIHHLHLVPKSFYTSLSQPNVLPKLQHLNVSLDYDSSKSPHFLGLGQGVTGAGLQSLSLFSHTIPDHRYAAALIPHLVGLQKLKLEIEDVDEWDLNYFAPECCTAIAKHCINLKELEISGLDDATMELLAADTPVNKKKKKSNNAGGTTSFRETVETISVYHSFLTPACISTLQRFSNLKALKIEYSGRFEEEVLAKFEEAFPGVVSVAHYGTELARFGVDDDDNYEDYPYDSDDFYDDDDEDYHDLDSFMGGSVIGEIFATIVLNRMLGNPYY